MGAAYSKYENRRRAFRVVVECKFSERDHLEHLDVDGRIKSTRNFKWGMEWIGLIWHKKGTGGGRLWVC